MKKYKLELRSKNVVVDTRYFNTLNECKECLKFHRAYSGVIRLTKTNEIKLIWINC